MREASIGFLGLMSQSLSSRSVFNIVLKVNQTSHSKLQKVWRQKRYTMAWVLPCERRALHADPKGKYNLQRTTTIF